MMRTSFINTISIDSEPYIFRFELHPSEKVYTVSVLNRKNTPPFTMAMTREDNWKIVGAVEDKIRRVEHLIALSIIESSMK